MDDEGLGRIEAKIDTLAGAVAGLTASHEQLKGEFADLKTGQGKMQADITDLKAGQAQMQGDIALLTAGQEQLRGEFADLKANQAQMQGDITGLKSEVADLKASQRRLEKAVEEVQAGQLATATRFEGQLGELRDHMGVLHEQVIERIRALGEDDSLRAEMQRGFAELREALSRHADVGDAVDRSHSALLADHERRLSHLEGQ